MTSSYPSPPTRTSLSELHPVEALLALLFLSAAALLRLVAQPPRPLRRPVPYSSAAACREIEQIKFDIPAAFAAAGREMHHIMGSIVQPQASGAPSPGIAPGLTVAELRTMARQRGLTTAGGRQIHKARRADLLTALEQ